MKNHVHIHVITYSDSLTGASEDASGVKVFRVANPVRSHVSLITWDLTLNQEIERAAANVYFQADKQIDLIDVF